MAIRLDWSNIGQGLKDVAGAIHERRYQRGAEDVRRRYRQEPEEVEAGQMYDFFDQFGMGPAAEPQFVPAGGEAPETPAGLTRRATPQMQYRVPGQEQMYTSREEAAAAMPAMSRAEKFYELADLAEREKMYDRAKDYRAQGHQQENLDSLTALRELQTDAARLEVENARFQKNLDMAARDGLPGMVAFFQQMGLNVEEQSGPDGFTAINADTGAPLFPPQASEAAAVSLAYQYLSQPGGFHAVLKAEEDAILARDAKNIEGLRTERDALGVRIKELNDMVKTGYDISGKRVPPEQLAEYQRELGNATDRYNFLTDEILLTNPAYRSAIASRVRGVPAQDREMYINGDDEVQRELERLYGPDVMRIAAQELALQQEEAGEEAAPLPPPPLPPLSDEIRYPTGAIDTGASVVQQFQQRSQVEGRVNERKKDIVQKLADMKPARSLPGFTRQGILRERDRLNEAIKWYRGAEPDRLLIENPELLNEAFNDPVGFYEKYKSGVPGMKNGGLVRGYQRGGRVTAEERAQFDKWIDQYATEYGVDPDFMKRLIAAESSYNPKAKSKAGAMGLGQLMPGTAKDMGVKDPYDPEQNIRGSAKYLGWLQGRHDTPAEVLAAYNAGTGRVRSKGLDWVMENIPETRDYVMKILPDYKPVGQVQTAGITVPPGGAPTPGQVTGRTPRQAAAEQPRGGLRGAMDRGSDYLGETTDTRENRRRIEKGDAPITRGEYLERAGDALSRSVRQPVDVAPVKFDYDPLGSGAALETLERSRVRGPQFGLTMAKGGRVKDYRDGGDVNGPGTKTSDSIPARLSDGEYVVNADAVALPGVEDLLEHINNLGLRIRQLDQQRRS